MFERGGHDGDVLNESVAVSTVGDLEPLYRSVAALASRSADRQTSGSGEDVAQALFERLCHTPGVLTLEHPGVRGWITLAAQRNAIDVARAEARRRARERRYADPRCAPSGDSPDDRVIAGEAAAMVRAAVARLDDKKRRAISLAFFDNLSHRQVAIALDIPLGTAKTRIRTALAELATMLPALRS